MPPDLPPLIPPVVRPPETASDDPRVGHLLGSALAPDEPARCAIIGFPVDEGVRRNGGRVGAAAGPAAIREAFHRLTPNASNAERFAALLARTRDLGDLRTSGDLERDQELLGEIVGACLRAGTIPIVLGGGHEATYGHFLGWVRAGEDVSLLNVDAHADVREPRDGRGHSGSSFRQALEHPSGRARGYTVVGLQPQSVAAAHLAYVREHGEAHFASAVHAALAERLCGGDGPPLLASFDLDAVDRAWAPGVSAPSTAGLTVRIWRSLARTAGRAPRVRSMDVVELNPALDRDGQTAMLAALTVWWFLAGVAERDGST